MEHLEQLQLGIGMDNGRAGINFVLSKLKLIKLLWIIPLYNYPS
jgi:hypothetical protein